MKEISRIVRLLFVTTSVFLVLSNVLASPVDDRSSKTITGVVIAAEWNDDGDVIAVAINVVETVENKNGESEEVSEDYLVADTEKGRELLKMVSDEVEATGSVRIDEDGNKAIFVSSYSLVESPDESEEEEDN